MAGRLAEQQFDSNARSRAAWRHFAPHRRKVTDLALWAGLTRRRLLVLGAGNCNDLELAELAEAYEEVHLVDLDSEALDAGLAAQGLSTSETLLCHGGIDLTGALPLLERYLETPPHELEAEGLVQTLAAAEPPLPEGPFDAVISTCLLTQMIDAVTEALGAEHPSLPEVVIALRRRHLELMVARTAAGGQAVLVSDMVSSETVPGLAETPPEELKPLVQRLLEERNFFTGANPLAILQSLADEPALKARLENAALAEPWLWQQGETRSYLVFALLLERRK